MEQESINDPLIQGWQTAMIGGAIIMIIIGIIIYIFHHIRIAAISNYKAKYDYINLQEIKKYKLVFLCFGIAAMMGINLYGLERIPFLGLVFFVRLFIGIAGGTLVIYVAFLILEYYYPTVVARKLRKWRYMPRAAKTGSKMRLLGEEEEDVHLQEGMQAEESVFSIDYDVWVDEQSDEVKVEKYPGHLQALQCGNCGFYTMKVTREEITRHPGPEGPGELIKHYQCSYCKASRATSFNISTKEPEDYKATATKKFKKTNNIDLVRVEIHSAISGRKFFEFQNLDQAMKFLEGYDGEK